MHRVLAGKSLKVKAAAIAAAATLLPAAVAGAPVSAERIAEGVYFLAGEDIGDLYVDGNTVAILTADGFLVYDTGARPSRAKEMVANLKKISRAPVRYVINSEWHPDHCTGNAVFKKAYPGAEIVSTDATRDFIRATSHSMRNVLSDAVARQEEAAASPGAAGDPDVLAANKAFIAEFTAAEIALPTLTYTGEMTLRLGSSEFRLLTLDGDARGIAAAYVSQLKILLAGDAVVYPLPYTPNSFAIGAWRRSLERIRELELDIIVPGHGPVMRNDDYVDLLIAFIARVEEGVAAALADGVKTADLATAIDLADIKARFIALDPANKEQFDDVARDLVRRAAQEARDGAGFVRG